jgi:HEPN domain-containing protein
MIPVATFQHLITQKTKDAQTLLLNNRNSSAVYLMGYAVEFALKRKICNTLGFFNGFPENKTDLSYYISHWNSIGTPSPIPANQLNEIKNHNLERLLTYSGEALTIKATRLNEWETIVNWNPENRYVIRRVSKEKAEKFIKSAKKIIRELL